MWFDSVSFSLLIRKPSHAQVDYNDKFTCSLNLFSCDKKVFKLYSIIQLFQHQMRTWQVTHHWHWSKKKSHRRRNWMKQLKPQRKPKIHLIWKLLRSRRNLPNLKMSKSQQNTGRSAKILSKPNKSSRNESTVEMN